MTLTIKVIKFPKNNSVKTLNNDLWIIPENMQSSPLKPHCNSKIVKVIRNSLVFSTVEPEQDHVCIGGGEN